MNIKTVTSLWQFYLRYYSVRNQTNQPMYWPLVARKGRLFIGPTSRRPGRRCCSPLASAGPRRTGMLVLWYCCRPLPPPPPPPCCSRPDWAPRPRASAFPPSPPLLFLRHMVKHCTTTLHNSSIKYLHILMSLIVQHTNKHIRQITTIIIIIIHL